MLLEIGFADHNVEPTIVLKLACMFSLTDANFPLYCQQSFVDFLASGGTIACLDRYLRRVEAALKPTDDEIAGPKGKLRDVTTLLRVEMSRRGVRDFERLIHKAEHERAKASAQAARAAANFEANVASSIRSIRQAVDLLTDAPRLAKMDDAIGRPLGVFRRPSARRRLLSDTRDLNSALEIAAAEPDEELRRDAFISLHVSEAANVTRCLEALQSSHWKLSSPFPRDDLPGEFGVVRDGHFAEYLALLKTAVSAWQKADREALEQKLGAVWDSQKMAEARARCMAALPADLMNWLALRSNFHTRPLRPKVAERRVQRQACIISVA